MHFSYEQLATKFAKKCYKVRNYMNTYPCNGGVLQGYVCCGIVFYFRCLMNSSQSFAPEFMIFFFIFERLLYM